MSSHQFRENAVTLVLAEMNRQDRKWGAQRKHHSHKWVSILTEEVGEVAKAALEQENNLIPNEADEFLKECVQVAAVACQMIEARMRSIEDAKRLGGANFT